MNRIPKHVMAQAEIRKVGEREVKAIPVAGMKYKEVMALVNCPASTAWDAVKRGYYLVDFLKRECIPGQLDIDKAYRMARWLFYKKFRGRLPEWADPEDMIQDGVTRLLELAGHPRIDAPGFAYRVINHGMTGHLSRNQRHAHAHEDEANIEAPGSKWGTWDQSYRATEAMVRMIEARTA